MAINGEHSIFRLSTSGISDETSTSDKIEFDGDAIIPDAKSHITGIHPIYRAVKTENPNPGSQDSSAGQDTGNAPFSLKLTGFIDKTSGSALAISSLFNVWQRQPKVIKTHYPKGRFGFRSDDVPYWNVTPGTTGGYRFVGIEYPYKPGITGQIPFILTLDFYGDMSLLGA